MDLLEQSKKLLTGELKERRAELCVDCPLYGKYVPITECFHLGTSEIREDGIRTSSSLRLHATPSDFWYEPKQKCEYAINVTTRPSSGDLVDIICSYKK